jgi:hypothetical protein
VTARQRRSRAGVHVLPDAGSSRWIVASRGRTLSRHRWQRTAVAAAIRTAKRRRVDVLTHAPGTTDFSRIDRLIEPPPVFSTATTGVAPRVSVPRARHVDFVERDAGNRRLGRLGEEWALEFEARRLHDQDRRPT